MNASFKAQSNEYPVIYKIRLDKPSGGKNLKKFQKNLKFLQLFAICSFTKNYVPKSSKYYVLKYKNNHFLKANLKFQL